MSDDQSHLINPFKREVGRRHIPGTHKIEIVYAVRDPQDPYNETMIREIVLERESSSSSNN